MQVNEAFTFLIFKNIRWALDFVVNIFFERKNSINLEQDNFKKCRHKSIKKTAYLVRYISFIILLVIE